MSFPFALIGVSMFCVLLIAFLNLNQDNLSYKKDNHLAIFIYQNYFRAS